MKVFYFVILFFVCGMGFSTAQTNTETNAAAATNQLHGVQAILALVTTNQPPTPTNAPAKSKQAQGPTTIDAVGPAVFDLNNHWVTYRDTVSVTNLQMKLTCEWLMANLPQGKEHVTNIVAETNVVINYTDDKGEKSRGTGNKAVYFYHVENGVTNETITLTGTPQQEPQLEKDHNTMTGDPIIYDLISHQLTIPNNPQIIGYPDTKALLGTNSPAVKTNAPALTKTNGG
jgi:lipopolysaccharide transport protein LptA